MEGAGATVIGAREARRFFQSRVCARVYNAVTAGFPRRNPRLAPPGRPRSAAIGILAREFKARQMCPPGENPTALHVKRLCVCWRRGFAPAGKRGEAQEIWSRRWAPG